MIAFALALLLAPVDDVDVARVAFEAGRPEEARDALLVAWEGDTHDPVALAANLGHVARELARPEEAVLWYRRALVRGGDDPELSAALAAVERELGVASRPMGARGLAVLEPLGAWSDPLWCAFVFLGWGAGLWAFAVRRRRLALVALLLVAPGAAWLVSRHVWPAPARAVVIVAEAAILDEPAGSGGGSWALGGGEWVEWIERRGERVRVEHPRGSGWIAVEALAVVDPEP